MGELIAIVPAMRADKTKLLRRIRFILRSPELTRTKFRDRDVALEIGLTRLRGADFLKNPNSGKPRWSTERKMLAFWHAVKAGALHVVAADEEAPAATQWHRGGRAQV